MEMHPVIKGPIFSPILYLKYDGPLTLIARKVIKYDRKVMLRLEKFFNLF